MPRLLGEMDHDECAPWCDHDPVHHAEDCSDSFCDGYECWQTKHHISFCDLCQTDIIICGKCGNNCCNGGYGTLPDGSTCNLCPSAYAKQKEMWEKRDSNAFGYRLANRVTSGPEQELRIKNVEIPNAQ